MVTWSPAMSLQLENITRRFGSHTALDRVSLCVRPGDCYGFIGHNGAGKTTAMRIALGLARPDEGRVVIDGFEAEDRPSEARARMGGLIEVPGFHGNIGGRTNLIMLGRLAGLGRREAAAEADRLLALVGLEHAATKDTGNYSHGMRQRLGIAQALLGRPRYVLLDEPTNGLDPEGIAEIRHVLHRLTREEGFSVLLSSHQLHEISDVCNRIGVLKQGRLVVEASTDELLGAAGARHELLCDDADRALEVLSDLGVSAERAAGEGTVGAPGTLTFDPGSSTPGEIARALVEAGLELEQFGPRPASLEEIYLRASHGDGLGIGTGDGAHPDASIEPSEAVPDRAPGASVWRMARYELHRWLARGRTPFLLLTPAALGVLAIWMRHRESLAQLALVEAGERYSTTQITAFEAFGIGLGSGLTLLAWIFGGLASQSIAGELSRGTLRNVLLCPLRRYHVVVGKALAVFALGLAAYLALAGCSYVAAGLWFEFSDLAEVLPNGELFALPGFEAGDLWPQLRAALVSPILPLLAGGSIGFLAGAFARTGAGARALARGALLGLDLLRTAARGAGQEAFLHTAYLPSPLGDTSFLKFYLDVAQGVSNTTFDFAGTAVSVPLAWLIAALVAAALLLGRRPIP